MREDKRKTRGARRSGECHQLTLISVNVGSLWGIREIARQLIRLRCANCGWMTEHGEEEFRETKEGNGLRVAKTRSLFSLRNDTGKNRPLPRKSTRFSVKIQEASRIVASVQPRDRKCSILRAARSNQDRGTLRFFRSCLCRYDFRCIDIASLSNKTKEPR
ncbi:hypothetical protein WN48_03229 [Eufriesea mexicana]|nr:hypothetical protein WN48_03229 [Eufriesea mexicana]